MISGIFLKVVSIALLIAVGIVLILGIGTLFKGGETSRKYSNKLMQLRILLQFIAILALVGFAYFFKNQQLYFFIQLTKFISSKSIEPITLANSWPSLLIKIDVGTPLKEKIFANVVGESK